MKKQKSLNAQINKYVPFYKRISIDLKHRKWPDNIIKQAPQWCAVDLRDGNQSLVKPMGFERKYKMFKLLIQMGYKEIEVGFPSASKTDFIFIKKIINENLIPEDVTIQVLTQAREHLIKKTYESLIGVKKVIVHIYNSTSILQRKIVFKKNKQGIIDIALKGAELCRKYEYLLQGSHITYEYSPESFTGTEPEFALQISQLVANIFEASKNKKMILNLPATIEMSTPNIYADSIEWMCSHLKRRDDFIISLHPHNDRGTAIAAAELGYLAGADRIEGCLFGNGERTGNVDLITLGLNLFSQGIDPKINFSNMEYIKKTVEYCNQMTVDKRFPYSGELVFTAFSGSHQDAIKKGFDFMTHKQSKLINKYQQNIWEVPYLPIDPKDIGRNYKAIIRVNSQSGKSGIAYLLQKEYKLHLPKKAQVEFSHLIQKFTDQSGSEINASGIWKIFSKEYLSTEDKQLVTFFKKNNKLQKKNQENMIDKYDSKDLYSLISFETRSEDQNKNFLISVSIKKINSIKKYFGHGNGPIDAFINIINKNGMNIKVIDYVGHALSSGGNALAAAYVECKIKEKTLWGIGIDFNTIKASLKAIISSMNRYKRKKNKSYYDFL